MADRFMIRVKGHIDEQHFVWCNQIPVTQRENGETILQGTIRDQAELYGILLQIQDLGMKLVSLTAHENGVKN